MQDKHFLYPDNLPPAVVVAMIQTVLNRAPANQDVWQNPGRRIANVIYRWCEEWGVNPAWVLVGLQRERGLYTKPATAHDFDFALGFVGKDGPGTVNELWNGLEQQIILCARGTGWLMGRGNNYGWRPGLAPTVRRWVPGQPQHIQLLGDDHLPAKGPDGILLPSHLCADLAEWVQLSYTPHAQVLDLNQSILERWAPEFL